VRHAQPVGVYYAHRVAFKKNELISVILEKVKAQNDIVKWLNLNENLKISDDMREALTQPSLQGFFVNG